MRRQFFAPADPPAPTTTPGVQPPSVPPPAQTPDPAAPPTPPATPPAAPPTPPPADPATPPAAPPTTPPATPPATTDPATPPATPAQAPASYELVLPADGPLDQTDLDLVATMGRERGWTNEQAQAVLNDMAQGLTAQRQAFLSELESHPTLGGAKLSATQQLAMRALDRFAPASTPDGAKLRSVLTKSGYGNFAPFVGLMAAIGDAMREDRPLGATPGGSAPDRLPTAQVLFGDSGARK